MLEPTSRNYATVSNEKASGEPEKVPSNLALKLISISTSPEAMSEKPQKINTSPSASVPDGGHTSVKGGDIYGESLLESKITWYREYRCRGHNLGNAPSMLKTLKSRLAAECMNGYESIVRDISALVPALEQLTGDLLTLETLENLTSEQRNVVNKREEVVRGLLHDLTLVLDFLPHTQAHIRETKREALRKELINSALDRFLNEQKNGKDRQAAEEEMRALVHTPPYLMSISLRERLESFFAAGLAKLNEPVKQELDRINHTLKIAYAFLSQAPDNNMPPGPNSFPVATTDFRHSVKKCTEVLAAVLNRVQGNIQETSTAQKDTADKRILHQMSKYLELPALFNKSTRSLPRTQLIRFDKAPADTRKLCLKLKEISQPVQYLAVTLQQLARELGNAIAYEKSQGIKMLPAVDTPEKALLAELQIMTVATPQTQILQANQKVRDFMLQMKDASSATSLPPSAVPTNTEKFFRDVILAYFDSLQEAAGLLNRTLQLAQNDLQQESLSDGFNRVISMTRNILDDLTDQLEFRTGVSLGPSREWLNKQQKTLLQTLHSVTRITGKIHTQYPALTHTAEQARINKDRFGEIHRSILPMLNQVEKIRVANRMLEMVLTAPDKVNNSKDLAFNAAIQKCKDLDLDDIRKTGVFAVQVSGTKAIAVYQRGDNGINHSTTLGKVLKRLSEELLTTAQKLQITAEYAAWSADKNKQKIKLKVAKMTKRLETIKAEIKDVVWAATGTRLHNNSPEGMIAKDAGEWLAIIRNEWGEKYTEQEIKKKTENVIQYIIKELVSEDDSEGQLFKTRIMLALKDAEGDGIPWPLTAEDRLAETRSNKAYIQAWAEKRLTYGMLYNLVIHGTIAAMFSVHKSSFVSPLRSLNLLLTPVRMEMTRRAMEKVRPGNPLPSAIIAEYESREKFQAAVRLVSMLSPQLPKTLAAIGITATGLHEGGDYRGEFLKRAWSRLPGDLFWLGGFAASNAAVQAYRKYSVGETVSDDQISAEMLEMLLEDVQATAGNEHGDEDNPIESRSGYKTSHPTELEAGSEISATSPNLTNENISLNEESSSSEHRITKRSTQTTDIFQSEDFKQYVRDNQTFKASSQNDITSAFLAENKITLPAPDYSVDYPRLDEFSSDKITVITNEDVPGEMEQQVYDMVVSGVVSDELKPYIMTRGVKAGEKKFYDTYHLYESALSGYSRGMRNQLVAVISQIRIVSAELYATYKSDSSTSQRSEALRVQLFYLTNLCKGKINIEFRPLRVTSVIREGVTTAPYEDETAGRIVDSVTPQIQEIPPDKRAVYGAAYQARRSILAYALYICDIHSIEDFNKSVLGKKDASGRRIMSEVQIYEYLINKITQFSSNKRYNILSEIAQHYYYSLGTTAGLTINPDIKYNVSEGKEKALRDFNLNDMIGSLGYYLGKDIDIANKRTNKELENLLNLLFALDLLPVPSISRGAKLKTNTRVNKLKTNMRVHTSRGRTRTNGGNTKVRSNQLLIESMSGKNKNSKIHHQVKIKTDTVQYGAGLKKSTVKSREGLSKQRLHTHASDDTITTTKKRPNLKGDEERIRRPKKADFSSEAEYEAAKARYDTYIKNIVRDYGIPESVKREKAANDKIEKLDNIKPIQVTDTQHGAFIVTSEVDNKADVLVFSAHGYYSPYSKDLPADKIPKGKSIIFLGPHNKTLFEAEQLPNHSATESLLIPGRYPKIYTRISSDGIETLKNKKPTASTSTGAGAGEASQVDDVKDYYVKYYEKTPDAEYTAAVKSNRIDLEKSGGVIKVDYARMSPYAGEKKLNDLIKLTKPGKPLSNYNTIIYYACREYKGKGQAQTTLGGGYTINFTDTPLSKQKRSASDVEATKPVEFDGLYITEKYTIHIDKSTDAVTFTKDVVGVILYEYS